MRIIPSFTTPTLSVRCLFLKILFSSASVVWQISLSHCGNRGGWKQAAVHHRSTSKCASLLVLGETSDKRAANKRPRCSTQNPVRGHRRLLGVKTKYFTASRNEQVWWVEDSRPEDKIYGKRNIFLHPCS